MNDYIVYPKGRVNEFGAQIKRTPEKCPYSYDGFITYRNGENKEANHTIYSDRIHNSEKYVKACEEVFGNSGQMFFNRKPEDIEKMLRIFYDDKDLKLIFVMQYCNVSSGFPLWRFEIKTK
jgi:hypothetical protein